MGELMMATFYSFKNPTVFLQSFDKFRAFHSASLPLTDRLTVHIIHTISSMQRTGCDAISGRTATACCILHGRRNACLKNQMTNAGLCQKDGGGSGINNEEFSRLRSSRTLVEGSRPSLCLNTMGKLALGLNMEEYKVMVVGEGLFGAKAPHPAGRCLWQRSLAYARVEPLSKILVLPSVCTLWENWLWD
jgi:hypothetical protein